MFASLFRVLGLRGGRGEGVPRLTMEEEMRAKEHRAAADFEILYEGAERETTRFSELKGELGRDHPRVKIAYARLVELKKDVESSEVIYGHAAENVRAQNLLDRMQKEIGAAQPVVDEEDIEKADTERFSAEEAQQRISKAVDSVEEMSQERRRSQLARTAVPDDVDQEDLDIVAENASRGKRETRE